MQLMKFPPGKLICSHDQGRCKWYQSDGHHKVYIPKNDRVLAQQLAAKKYLSLQLADYQDERQALLGYLRRRKHGSPPAQKLLTDSSEYQKLLTPYFTPLSEELTNWMKSPYERNTLYPEQLIHKSISGNYLRSKSEAMIDMFLYVNKIPFRYECLLMLGETVLYPDFMIRHPKSGDVFYWEHFGMMDNPSYSANAFSKLQLYTAHKIIPSIHLITTYETKDYPLTMDMVEKIIEQYFM